MPLLPNDSTCAWNSLWLTMFGRLQIAGLKWLPLPPNDNICAWHSLWLTMFCRLKAKCLEVGAATK